MPLAHLDPHVRHPRVFLTVCTAKRVRVLDNVDAHSILSTIWHESRERDGWWVGRYVIMPDHVHLFAMPDGNPESLSEWVAMWKSISVRQVVRKTRASPPIWQRDYFDRFLRTRESDSAKWDYVFNNPVRAKLTERAEDWPYQGVIHELDF